VSGPVEAAAYERRRLLAALLGGAGPPPGLLRPLACGVLLAGLLAGAEVLRRLW
jgi:hypothetical protein